MNADRLIPVAPEGYTYVLFFAIVGVFAWTFGYPWIAGAVWLLGLASLAFFRDPRRVSDAAPPAVLAPADGKVILIGESPPDIAGMGLPQQVSIFMSPANVHVNRAPIAGTVQRVDYVPGQKLPAFRDKASALNEHSFVVLEGAVGRVAFKQIAGALARRVVCDLATGNRVERGQRVGIIKFGSRVDLFLPPEAVLRVHLGMRTRAGLTVVAELVGVDA